MGKIIAEAKEADTHKDDVEKLVFSSGHLFSGAYDGTVKKWTTDLKCVKTFQAHDYPVYSMAADDDDENNNSFFTSSGDGEIKEWDSNSCEMRQMTIMINPVDKKPTEVKSIACRKNMLFAGDMTGILRRYQKNFVQDREKFTYSEVWGLAVSPDGKRVFTARDNTVLVSDITDDLKREEFHQSLDVSASIEGRTPVVVDDNFVALGDRSGLKVRVHKNDEKKYELMTTLEGHEMIVNAILLDKERVVSSGWDGLVKVWGIEEGKEVKEQAEVGCYVNALSWCPGERDVVFAAGKGGKIVKIQF